MLTLADMAQLSTLTPFQQAVIYSILSQSQLFERLPFDDTGDINTMVMEARGLPTPSHRAINPTSINVATAKFGQRMESLKIISDKITVDRQLRNNKSSHVDPRTAAIERYTKAVAYEMVDMFVNGNPITNPDQPGGMAYRFATDLRLSDGTPTPGGQKQVVDANSQNLDLTVTANQTALLDNVHALISLIDGGNPDILLVNRQGRLALGRAARALRMFRQDRDMFGRPVDVFGDIPVIDAGYPPAGAFDRSVQVIPTGTTQNDMTTDSIFAIKFGTTQVGALRKMAPETIDFAENSADFPNVVAAYEHVYGFQITNPFAIALGRRFY